MSAAGTNGAGAAPEGAAVTALAGLPGFVIRVLPTGTAIPGPGPTGESRFTPKVGGGSSALGGASLGGRDSGGGVGLGAGARRIATRGRGSARGGGGSGATGFASGGGGTCSSTSISMGVSAWKRAGSIVVTAT